MKKVFAVLLVVLVLSVLVVPVASAQGHEHHSEQVLLQDGQPPLSDGVDSFSELIELFKESFPAGGWIALAVLIFVYAARINGLVINGKWARISNVLLSTILSGLDPLNPNAEQALVAIIASLGSGLIYELIQLGAEKLKEQKKTAEVSK